MFTRRKPESVDAIMSTFIDTIGQLEEISEIKEGEALAERQAAEAARMREEEARAEAQKARSTVSNLNKLLGIGDAA